MCERFGGCMCLCVCLCFSNVCKCMYGCECKCYWVGSEAITSPSAWAIPTRAQWISESYYFVVVGVVIEIKRWAKQGPAFQYDEFCKAFFCMKYKYFCGQGTFGVTSWKALLSFFLLTWMTRATSPHTTNPPATPPPPSHSAISLVWKTFCPSMTCWEYTFVHALANLTSSYTFKGSQWTFTTGSQRRVEPVK